MQSAAQPNKSRRPQRLASQAIRYGDQPAKPEANGFGSYRDDQASGYDRETDRLLPDFCCWSATNATPPHPPKAASPPMPAAR